MFGQMKAPGFRSKWRCYKLLDISSLVIGNDKNFGMIPLII